MWLTSAETLSAHIGLSLMDRSKLFERQYPDRKMNAMLLTKIYRMYGVKKKAISWKKRLKPNTALKYDELKQELRQKVLQAKQQGYEILYTDECMFTRKTV